METTTEITNASETTTSAPVARVLRRVYVDHKEHGTCVTYRAMVYLAPEGAAFEKKSTPHLSFTVVDGALIDEEGRVWLDGGENGGCGPRCPKALKEEYGKVWRSLPRARRAELVKSIQPAAKSAVNA